MSCESLTALIRHLKPNDKRFRDNQDFAAKFAHLDLFLVILTDRPPTFKIRIPLHIPHKIGHQGAYPASPPLILMAIIPELEAVGQLVARNSYTVTPPVVCQRLFSNLWS